MTKVWHKTVIDRMSGSRVAAVIDPKRDVDTYLEDSQSQQKKITAYPGNAIHPSFLRELQGIGKH